MNPLFSIWRVSFHLNDVLVPRPIMCDNTDITTLTQVRPFKGHWTCPLMERNFLFLGLSECLTLLEWDFPLHIGMKYIQLMQNMSPSQFIHYWWGGQPTQSQFGSFQFVVFVITTAGASVYTAGCSPSSQQPSAGMSPTQTALLHNN